MDMKAEDGGGGAGSRKKGVEKRISALNARIARLESKLQEDKPEKEVKIINKALAKIHRDLAQNQAKLSRVDAPNAQENDNKNNNAKNKKKKNNNNNAAAARMGGQKGKKELTQAQRQRVVNKLIKRIAKVDAKVKDTLASKDDVAEEKKKGLEEFAKRLRDSLEREQAKLLAMKQAAGNKAAVVGTAAQPSKQQQQNQQPKKKKNKNKASKGGNQGGARRPQREKLPPMPKVFKPDPVHEKAKAAKMEAALQKEVPAAKPSSPKKFQNATFWKSGYVPELEDM